MRKAKALKTLTYAHDGARLREYQKDEVFECHNDAFATLLKEGAVSPAKGDDEIAEGATVEDAPKSPAGNRRGKGRSEAKSPAPSATEGAQAADGDQAKA